MNKHDDPSPWSGGRLPSLSAAAALAVALAAGFAVTAVPAQAAVSSASINDLTATLNLDGADDDVTVSASGGLLVHEQFTGGLNSRADWDSTTDGDQTVPADGTFVVIVNGGDGNDSLTVLANFDEVAAVGLDGGPGDDVLTGAASNDTLNGDEGNDRIVGAGGADVVNGGAGNDTLGWNNGDGSDTLNGDAGNDGTEVNGAATAGDVFSLDPNAGRVKFQRTNLKVFTLDASTERFQVNGLGGDDSFTANDGVGAFTLLSVDGGAGADTINGSEGADLILGGEGNDVLSGGGGDDRVVGDRGTDTMDGGLGDDTLVWNNGDGTDVVNGDGGSDDVEVNGAAAAGDTFTVQPNGARIKFDRSNLVPFSIDIGSSETLHANGLGGNDSIVVGEVGPFEVTGAGGAGNDALAGGSSSETFLGGSGNDTITPGGGSDAVFAGDGDDQVNVRDNTADLARGGDGNDSVVTDAGQLDILNGFETVDRTPNVTPPPVDNRTRPVAITGGVIKVKSGTALIKLTCPAGTSGNCTGSLTLRTAEPVKLAGVKAVLQLGTARFTIAPGAAATVKVKLVKGSKSLANDNGRIKVQAVASTGPAGKIALSSRRLVLAVGTVSR
jgi:Ca2+-binding RTX toxin-like protein